MRDRVIREKWECKHPAEIAEAYEDYATTARKPALVSYQKLISAGFLADFA